MARTEFDEKFANLINAGFPYIYIPSYEEERVVLAIRETLANESLVKTKRQLYIWTQTEGIISDEKRLSDTKNALTAIEQVRRNKEEAVYVFKDFHIYFGADRNTHPDYQLIRKLRDILPDLKASRKTIVILSPSLVLPADMEKEISVLDFDLPDMDELEMMLHELEQSIPKENIRLDAKERRDLIRSALGMTMQEAENAFCRAIVRQKGLDASAVSIIHEEKNQIVKKTGVLEFVQTNLSEEDIGGLENLKKWLMKRNGAWQERAREYGIPAPKGVLITGVPGCGKSLTAKAMSSIWKLPLLKLDMGKIFGGLLGSSEENIRKAIQTAEAVSPSILWIDEIEKGFTGTKSGGDSGTAARVFGTFLTWMQEKEAPVFVIATANDIESLPPELLRKGRFDEIFFVDLPTEREREKIFQVHLDKRMGAGSIKHEVATDRQTLKELAALTEGFSGAEIEQVVIAGLYEAFFNDRGLETDDLKKSIRDTVPLSVLQKEQIRSLKEWAGNRAVLATAWEDREEAAPGSGRITQSGRIVDFDLLK
jgi:SpoVK/Ycf46/Vps4 family AAA+-type ATPase